VDIWPASPSFGEGWRRGYCIIVPSTDLRPWPQPEPGDIAFAPPPRYRLLGLYRGDLGRGEDYHLPGLRRDAPYREHVPGGWE
jgi:hypothetical protein